MSKNAVPEQLWVDYFVATKGRTPTAKEKETALKKGEFFVEVSDQVINNQATYVMRTSYWLWSPKTTIILDNDFLDIQGNWQVGNSLTFSKGELKISSKEIIGSGVSSYTNVWYLLLALAMILLPIIMIASGS